MWQAFPNVPNRLRHKVKNWNGYWIKRFIEMINLGVANGILNSDYAIGDNDPETLDRALQRMGLLTNLNSVMGTIVGIYNSAMTTGLDKMTGGWFGNVIKVGEAPDYVKKVKGMFHSDYEAIDSFTMLF